jgi:hypothetical protein
MDHLERSNDGRRNEGEKKLCHAFCTLVSILLLLLFAFSCIATAQPTSIGPLQTDYRTYMTSFPYCPGIQDMNSVQYVGLAPPSDGGEAAAFYEWLLPDNRIPDGSTITQATLEFTATPVDHQTQLTFWIGNEQHEWWNDPGILHDYYVVKWYYAFVDNRTEVLANNQTTTNNTYNFTFTRPSGATFLDAIAMADTSK